MAISVRNSRIMENAGNLHLVKGARYHWKFREQKSSTSRMTLLEAAKGCTEESAE